LLQGISYIKNLKMTNLPLITIVTSSFNDCRLLKQTIANIAAQTYPNIQYVVVDGGSSDGTVELLQNSASVIDVWISGPDHGIYDAWNKALELAKGDYIAFLGAGDAYLSEGLEALVNLAVMNKDAEFIYGKVFVEGIRQRPRVIGQPWRWVLFRRYMCTTHVGALHSRQLFNRYGIFNTRYKIAGDYELLLRAKKDLKSVFLDRATATMLAGGISQRNHQVLHEVRQAKIEHQAVNVIVAHYDFAVAYIKLFIRQKFLT
jgi:glycosyltransferase involved in cell wall biosynthesis